ncbi:uncharacterized protein LOC131605695 [Vicia villosa]|uniref:uncharacterized protein LOC131605695 n=1 Tax=Vicia villosa TaxID=3911 RepID=UPI00273AD6D3|nr:uncharacterized protein LOC131605695 [Vicia villosa]
MPIPWINKNRVTQFSQIIADLHSSKRGASSIFVQTAFPASLVDLLINNRTRFTRPKSNKPFRRRTSDPPSPEMPSLTDYAELDRHEYASLTQLTTDENLHANNGVEDSGHGVNRVGKNNDGSGSKTLLVTFIMMLVIVVSIASVEKLTVGITLSAFAVLFLEYAWKRVVLCSKPNVEINVVEAEFEEIKVVGVCSEETSSYDDVFQLNSVKGDKKLDYSESEEQEYHSNEKVVDSCHVSIKVSRRVKLKSKLKKLLTKKLQSSGKEVKEKRGKEDCSVEKDCEIKEEVDNGSKSSLLHDVKLESMRVNSEKKRTERVGNSGYLVLFVIALVGLVVGRLPALILTMTWCFILKIVAIRGRSKASLIKCSVPNS